MKQDIRIDVSGDSSRLASLGEYEKVDHQSSVNQARYLFLKAVEKCEPRVVGDLTQGEPGQLFKKIPHEIAMGLWRPSLQENKGTVALGQALAQWGRRWQLQDDWCIEQALEFLKMWFFPDSDFDEETGEVVLEIDPDWASWVSFATITTDEEMRFTFEHRGGDLAIQTKKEIKDDIRHAFEKRLDAYVEGLQALATERGYKPVLKKYNHTHFEMLARYQVSGWPHRKVAAEYHYPDADTGANTVAHILPKAAKLIGLTLRKAQGKRGKDKSGLRRERRRSS